MRGDRIRDLFGQGKRTVGTHGIAWPGIVEVTGQSGAFGARSVFAAGLDVTEPESIDPLLTLVSLPAGLSGGRPPHCPNPAAMTT